MNPNPAPSDPVRHLPVLFQSVLHWLQPAPGRKMIDGTVGGGGHAEGFLAAGAQVLGLDRDPDALASAGLRLAGFGDRLILRQASYRRADEIVREIGWNTTDGILLDLGLSSLQLADPERGMAFREDGPLDMRFDRTAGDTAADLLNTLPQEELERILFQYGEEPDARKIARAIVSRRPLRSTRELAELVAAEKTFRGAARRSIHPATCTFQALRIAVNGELDELAEALPRLLEILAAGGRLAVITFHSLEDRLVKRAMRDACGKEWRRGIRQVPYAQPAEPAFRDLTPRPIGPDRKETAENPRARSAKLRVVEKTLSQTEPIQAGKSKTTAVQAK
jgi:16S rRNA (cytosine1402-N4)-methyltransferase